MSGRPADAELGAAGAAGAPPSPSSPSSAAPWAAAALIVAVGALGFAVAAHLRAADLERRIDAAERAVRQGGPAGDGGGEVTVPSGATTVVTVTSSTTSPANPVDPGGARRGIDAAFLRAYDGSIGARERLEAIDDSAGVEAGLRLLYSGAYATVANSSQAVVDNVSFLSGTRAMVGYSVQIDGGGFAGRAGEARVVGGEWKVTRATFCADLLALSAPCSG